MTNTLVPTQDQRSQEFPEQCRDYLLRCQEAVRYLIDDSTDIMPMPGLFFHGKRDINYELYRRMLKYMSLIREAENGETEALEKRIRSLGVEIVSYLCFRASYDPKPTRETLSQDTTAYAPVVPSTKPNGVRP